MIKQVPSLRKDLVSKKMYPKVQLLKIVFNTEGILVIDWQQNILGRSAYLADHLGALLHAQEKKLLERSFKRKLPLNSYQKLISDYQNNKLR